MLPDVSIASLRQAAPYPLFEERHKLLVWNRRGRYLTRALNFALIGGRSMTFAAELSLSMCGHGYAATITTDWSGMGKLIYAAIASLDGYVEDAEGKFDWARPDEEVHAFVNDVERPIGTYLYGRRMYETMVFWETASAGADEPAVFDDYARIWRAAEKVVYSRTLETATSARTRIAREFDRESVRRLKLASEADLSVGGAQLAGQAIGAGLVDECHLLLFPIVVGGGKRALPDDVRAQLELLDERRFGSGVLSLRYRVCG